MKTTLIVLSALLLTACNSEQPKPKGRIAEVGYVTMKTESVAIQSELPGRTSAVLSAEVRPQVSGIVQARKFEEGSLVKAGQVLYVIDPSSLQASADEAQAALTNAQAAVASARLKSERYAELLPIQGVSKQDADDARAAYQQAEAAVAQKKAALATVHIQLGQTQVRAPISGRIGKSTVTAGSLVTANQTAALATIRALDPIYVDLTQSSASLLQLRRTLAAGKLQSASTDVHLKLEDGTDYPSKGKLKFSEVAVDESTGSVTLRAEFPNPDGALLPGMYVRAVLDSAVDPLAILVPQQGVARDPKGNPTVLVVNAENQVELRSITTQRSLGDKWLVSSGVSQGDRVVVEGTGKVRAGDTVVAVSVGQKPTVASAPAGDKAAKTASGS